MKKSIYPLAAFGLAFTVHAAAAPVMMDAEWAVAACDGWNASESLTAELGSSGWAGNDGGKGHKVLHLYRTDCGEDAPTAELRISLQDGQARCVYGGAVETTELDDDVDYVMHATTERWQQMGAGDYGPMKAMMFGRLKFAGPKWEAMTNMGPFENFLLLAGSLESDTTGCP